MIRTDPRGPSWRQQFGGDVRPCGVPGCDGLAAGRIWACRAHWVLLPVGIRDRLMAHVGKHPINAALAEAEALLWIEENL